MSAFSSLMFSSRFYTHLYGPLVLNASGVNLGYFAFILSGKIALPFGFKSMMYDFYNDQQSDQMPGDEEDQNGLHGGNSKAGGCVSDVQPGDEVEP